MFSLRSFDIRENFWDVYPELQPHFSHLLEDFSDPSKVMWATLLFAHPDSPYYDYETTYRQENINREFLAEPIDWECPAIEAVLEKIDDLLLTKSERFLKAWEDKLEERAKFIGSIEYNAETYTMLDAMMSKSDKMWQQYRSCLADVQKEREQRTSGGFLESLNEQNKI